MDIGHQKKLQLLYIRYPYWSVAMERKLIAELKKAKKNLDSWYANSDCYDPETEEWLLGIIEGLQKAMDIVCKGVNG